MMTCPKSAKIPAPTTEPIPNAVTLIRFKPYFFNCISPSPSSIHLINAHQDIFKRDSLSNQTTKTVFLTFSPLSQSLPPLFHRNKQAYKFNQIFEYSIFNHKHRRHNKLILLKYRPNQLFVS